MLLAPVAAMLVQSAISQQREFAADAGGAQFCGNPESLAAALMRIEQAAAADPLEVNPATESMYIISPLRAGEKFSRLFSSHPPTEERVKRLRQMRPSF
jgi:heat shock protein HtpX